MVYGKLKQRQPWKKHLMSFVCVIIASLIMSLNIKSFVRAGNLLPGGFNGLTLLIQRIASELFHTEIPYSFINITLNAIPAYIGFKTIGKNFTGYSILMIVLNSFLVDILPSTPVTSDPLLVAIFGGILNGLSISIALYGNASSGGTDFIAVFLSDKFNTSSWNLVLGLNVIILTVSGILFGFEAALYSIIFQFVSTQVIHRLYQRDQRTTLFIITSNPEKLEKRLLSYTHHGITRFEGKGCYLDEPRTLLYTVVAANEVKDVIDFVKGIDPKAFVNISRSMKIEGGFYKEPRD